MRITDSLTTLGSSSSLLLLPLFVMVVVVVVVESRYYLPEKENVLFYVFMFYVIMCTLIFHFTLFKMATGNSKKIEIVTRRTFREREEDMG